MKITEQRLKQIIKEEVDLYNEITLAEEEAAVDFGDIGDKAGDAAEEVGSQINDIILKKAIEIAKAAGDETLAGAVDKVIKAAIQAAG